MADAPVFAADGGKFSLEQGVTYRFLAICSGEPSRIDLLAACVKAGWSNFTKLWWPGNPRPSDWPADDVNPRPSQLKPNEWAARGEGVWQGPSALVRVWPLLGMRGELELRQLWKHTEAAKPADPSSPSPPPYP